MGMFRDLLFRHSETRHAFGAIEWHRGSTGFEAESYVESRIHARNSRRKQRFRNRLWRAEDVLDKLWFGEPLRQKRDSNGFFLVLEGSSLWLPAPGRGPTRHH